MPNSSTLFFSWPGLGRLHVITRTLLFIVVMSAPDGGVFEEQGAQRPYQPVASRTRRSTRRPGTVMLLGMTDPIRDRVLRQMQGAAQLHVAYVGIATGALDSLACETGSVEDLARRTGCDAGYLQRWADAAFAFELVERDGERLSLSELGRAFTREAPGTLLPFAVQTVLGAHMAERAAVFARTGEQPGEVVLGERESILPLFGPMLELTFGPLLDQVAAEVPVFRRLDAEGGLAVDLGCGNGWYLRRLAARSGSLRGSGSTPSRRTCARRANAPPPRGSAIGSRFARAISTNSTSTSPPR